MSKGELFPKLRSFLDACAEEVSQVPPERAERLTTLARYVRDCLDRGETAQLTFICTHNSRRSHLGQLLAWASAAHHGVEGVRTFSGGTEATAFAPPAVDCLVRAGFCIERVGAGANPTYQVQRAAREPGLRVFSKVFDHAANPSRDFCAIMTCSEADANCPFVPGAAARVSLPYDDPKISDGTDQQADVYDARCREIGRDLMCMFSLVQGGSFPSTRV